jgi:hypothetical protein
VRFELFVRVIEEALDSSFLDGAVHPFDLSVAPWMVRLCESVFDSVEMAAERADPDPSRVADPRS